MEAGLVSVKVKFPSLSVLILFELKVPLPLLLTLTVIFGIGLFDSLYTVPEKDTSLIPSDKTEITSELKAMLYGVLAVEELITDTILDFCMLPLIAVTVSVPAPLSGSGYM